MKTLIDFIEEFYPNYHSSDEIAQFLDLSGYLSGEFAPTHSCYCISAELDNKLLYCACEELQDKIFSKAFKQFKKTLKTKTEHQQCLMCASFSNISDGSTFGKCSRSGCLMSDDDYCEDFKNKTKK